MNEFQQMKVIKKVLMLVMGLLLYPQLSFPSFQGDYDRIEKEQKARISGSIGMGCIILGVMINSAGVQGLKRNPRDRDSAALASSGFTLAIFGGGLVGNALTQLNGLNHSESI